MSKIQLGKDCSEWTKATDIDNVRGQGYDNGSNMKRGNKGVQKKFLDVNSRAFYSLVVAIALI